MATKKSYIWNYFRVENDEAFCTASADCKSKFQMGEAGGNQQANLKRHLKRKHLAEHDKSEEENKKAKKEATVGTASTSSSMLR